MFDLKLNEPKVFTNAISVISEFITEATFAVTKDGIKLIAMDPANISMVVLNILPSAFTEYAVKSDGDLTVNLAYLNQALKRAKATDSVALSIESNKLKVEIFGKEVYGTITEEHVQDPSNGNMICYKIESKNDTVYAGFPSKSNDPYDVGDVVKMKCKGNLLYSKTTPILKVVDHEKLGENK